MTNVTPISSIPTRPEQEIPIRYDIKKLEGGGVWITARHPRLGTLSLTVTPSSFENFAGKWEVRTWRITSHFREYDEHGEPLWRLPELSQTVHGTPSTTLEEGIEDAKRVAESELRQLRAWDFDDWRKGA